MMLVNEKLIFRPVGLSTSAQVQENDFVHCLIPTPEKGQTAEKLSLQEVPQQNVSVPFSFWQANKAKLLQRDHEVAVQLGAADFAEDILDDLADIKTIVLTFESAADGRSYSHAYLLRTRYHFKGQIRAIGDVHYDQLNFLARCGCDAFEIPDHEDSQQALDAFESFSEIYQPSADGGNLVFVRRRLAH